MLTLAVLLVCEKCIFDSGLHEHITCLFSCSLGIPLSQHDTSHIILTKCVLHYIVQVEMKKDETVQMARAEEARKSKQKAEALKDQNVEDLTVGMVLYKRLGLTFEKGDNGSLRFVFTQIDRNVPDRPFTFKLCVNDVALYEIKECSPPLSAGLILRLVDALNESHEGSTDGFSTFVLGMRNAFKETI